MDDKTAPIKDVVKNVISKMSGDEPTTSEDINSLWESVAGKKAAVYSKPVSLRKGRLVINVSNSSLLYDLTLQKKSLLQKLSKKVKAKKISLIQFRIGEV